MVKAVRAEVKCRLSGSPGHGHLGEGHSALLSSRQAGHWPGGQLPCDAITPQLVAVLLLITPCKQQTVNKRLRETVVRETIVRETVGGVPGNLLSSSSTEQTLRSSWST